ncbi:hypothetical protein BJ138DRAFT_1121031 [Hygrophoropsis aurantiaca]|uniref:Uncharacterized protein n=1 Tax=Hygrophoropsis aurantiaca TaxID=72124 RepID=A0ACB7ZPZ2_9AGAM|nr:hypothetical protein BJ138DRAFT_1121031 [Hygrophoropsis aurantiaca]
MLFVRMTPNTTAWCKALETFLYERGYKLTTQDNLRRRFSNAFHWYSVLTIIVADHISDLIHQSPSTLDSTHDDHPSAPEDQPRSQPSSYLRSRCPLCFGGSSRRQEQTLDTRPDCIVCIDACFTQKRSNNARNSASQDPASPTSSVFVSDDAVKSMECHVDQLRENGKRRQKRPRIVVEGDEDEYEDGMRIPVLVLDGCGASFLAADEKREKASTWFFADTGLMAMLCCHDRVLWLVNMTSAGEKQHYALTLINTLFNHIPADMTVGLLYNIGCQLERSCRKWNFLPDAILSRMSFAISVFHAYGHQWPCQIIYHPRKCIGFGLSDGEGCERLWSSLKPLIPVLRVSGYHQRLFVLDVQVHQLDAKSLAAFGQWLSRKWIQCQAKKGAALDKLATLGVSDDLLREEWAAQIAYQTKPLPRRSKSKGAEAIANILALEKTLDIHQSTVKDLERQLVTNRVSDIIDFNLQLSEARRRRDTIIETLARRRMALDVSERSDLEKLKKNHYLQL